MDKELEEILNAKEIKPTAMRLLVLKEIKNTNKVTNFYELEQKFDISGRATLYRTLKLFEEKHIVHPINDGSGSVKYAMCEKNCNCTPEELHVHFFCRECKMTFCMTDIAIPNVKTPENYIVETANYVLKGICADCKNKL